MASRIVWRGRALSLALGAGLGFLASAYAGSSSLLLPSGFTDEVLVSGLNLPTAFASLPDGRLLIAEKAGVVRLFANGALQPTPFIDLRDRVNNFHDRGLLGIAADPDFETNGSIYLLYTYEHDASNITGPKTGRLARYTAEGDTASPESEHVLLGTVVGDSCNHFPPGTDCIPSDSASHTVGNVKFAPDGTLFITLGDGARFDGVDDDALRAQDLNSLAGKVLHITRDGEGVPSNPFWNGDAGANRSKVWSYGLRNPYRFNLRPSTGTPYVGDVGWGFWEEINVAKPGRNFGWPCYEGPERQLAYAPKLVCLRLYNQGPSAVMMPLHYWGHEVGSTATGGAFYTGTTYPGSYEGAYFFGDYSGRWISFLRVDEDDNLIPGSVTTFASGEPSPVDIELGPDALLYYVDIRLGALRRFSYSGLNTPPIAVASATPQEGYPPLLVSFSSAGSHDPDGDALQYAWDFGDGSPPSELADPEHTYESAGLYTARLSVDDGRGGTSSTPLRISVGNLSPVPTIASPSGELRFKVGEVISYSGSATDPEDGELPASQLSWAVTLQHCADGDCHAHPYTTSTGPSGSFTVENHDGEIFFDITLTATDAQGLTGTSTVRIHPQTVQLTLQSFPPGLRLVVDSRSGPAPLTQAVVVGSTHTLYAPSPQSGYLFESWSDGRAQEHAITVGTSDLTFTASFRAVDCAEGELRAEYFNTPDLTGWPALVRCESAPFAHDWGTGSPSPEVRADQFSVRWTGQFSFPAGSHTFTATADDGVRVYVDGEVLINAWWDQSATTYEAQHALSAGVHTVVMEYYENDADAVAHLRWGPTPCAYGELRGEYFNSPELSGPPVLVTCEAAPFSYDWGEGSPAPEVQADQFSARWTGRFYFTGGAYTFSATADDGVRVFVDGALLIDAWWDQGPTHYRAHRSLSFGEHTVVMEYYENGGGAVAGLRWWRRF